MRYGRLSASGIRSVSGAYATNGSAGRCQAVELRFGEVDGVDHPSGIQGAVRSIQRVPEGLTRRRRLYTRIACEGGAQQK
jgi:hypothetical protein